MEAAALGLRVDGVEGIDRATSSLDRLTDSAQKTERASDQLAGRTHASSRSIAEVSRESERASRAMATMTSAAMRLGGALAAAFSVRQLTRYADTWTNMTSRVELSIGAHEDAADVMGQLADISRQTYATIESTTEAFARNSFTLRALGKSTQDQINFTAALNNALAVSGAEGERALMVQNSLSRAMAEGTLRGEDLNNVLNSGSRVAELLAENLGINVTQLRAVAAEGQLTSAVIYDSLVGAMDTLSEESMGMGSTVRGSMRLMSNATLEAVGQLNQMYDVSGSVARRIVQLSDAIRGIDWATHAGWISATAGATGALAAAYGTAAVASGVLTVATRLLNAVMNANPYVLAASAVVALGGALYGARNAVVTFADTTASVMDWMRGAWMATGEVVGTTMGRALEASEGYWQSFVGYLGWAWDWMGTTFAALMTTIGNAVKQGVNWQIGLFLSVGDTVEILANAMIDAFKGAFDNILKIGKGFWESLTQIIQGNLDFEPFNAALRGAFVEPMKAALSEIGTAVSENMSTDHIGNAIEIVSDSITKFGEATSDYAFQSSMMRIEVDGAVETLEDLGETITPIIDSTDKLTKSQREFASAFQTLYDRLRPLEASQRRYREEQAKINRAVKEGLIPLEAKDALLRDLERDYRNAADAAEVYGFTGKKVLEDSAYDFRTWEEVATSTISRVDNAGQDLWLGFIDGSRNALDTVKRFFQQTLAEIAHMLVTQRLTVAVAGSLGLGGSGAAMAGDGGGFGGMGSMLSTGRNVWNAAQQGFGNIAWTGVPTSYTGGWAGSATAGMGTTGGSSFLGGSMGNYQGMQGLAGAGAGLAGGWAGNKVFGDSEHGGTLSTIGGTIGAYWGPIGAAIGSFIGSGLGKLIGGSQTSPELNLRTVATGTMPSGGTGWEHHGKAYTSGVFGDIGFADRGTSRLRKQFPDGEHEFLEAIAGMDAMMASLAQSEEQFKAMESAARSWSARAGGPQGIVDQLSDRTATILGALDGEFGKFVRSLDGGLEEVVAQALIAREALTLLSASQERLGFRFNEAAKGAYESAFAIAELAGGLDNLAAMQEAYYQAYFSEAERAAHLQEDLTQALSELGLQLPASRDGFRALVEAQDLNSKAGQRNYVALLQLAGGFDQLQQALGEVEYTADRLRDTWGAFQRDSLRMQQELLTLAGDSASVLALARGQELAAMDESLRPFQERLWALQDEAEALNNYHRELERVGTQLGSALDQIQGFVDQRRGAMGTPAQNLEELERQWREQLSLAQSGDMSALRSITQYADRLMQAGQEYFASGEGFQDIQEQVLSALEGLDNLTAEEFLADEIRDAIEGLDIDQIAQTALDELAALQSLHDTTQSQVSLLVDINQSVISVRDALEGMGAVPSFASGGYHSGGLRLVGERGPELEVTGPSRIYDAATTRSMLSPAPLLGGSDVAELLQDLKRELVATREENRRLLERVGDNTGATVGAIMQGNETSARQRSEQIREQRAANRAARITKGGRVT